MPTTILELDQMEDVKEMLAAGSTKGRQYRDAG
jgi:hypothetical protein